MAHAAHTVTTDGVGPAEHHAFDQTGLFATVCRALSIVSGGFLLGTNQGWGALVGLGLGLSAWLANRSRYSPQAVSDARFGAWAGLLCAVVFLAVPVTRNRRLIAEQIGFTVAGALACQNILPPLKFIWFALTAGPSHALPPPLVGLEKYLARPALSP